MNSEASGSPQQRIITSEQWVFDRGSKEDTHPECRPRKASSSSKEERELRRRQREIENEQLQQEYNTVHQENSKLKNVIARLRQDIDVYMQLLAGSASVEAPGTNLTDELPPMETMLVNTSKRRKHASNRNHTWRDDRTQETSQNRVASTSRLQPNSNVPVLKDTQTDVMLAPPPPGTGDVGPDDLALMRRLKDVLAQME